MLEKEKVIRRYFNTWLNEDGTCLSEIFDDDIVYSECYGPEYRGIEQINKWFNDWNKNSKVLKWEIKQFIHQDNKTATEWYFECDYCNKISGFDGVSIIEFNEKLKIVNLKEFESKCQHEFPYEK